VALSGSGQRCDSCPLSSAFLTTQARCSGSLAGRPWLDVATRFQLFLDVTTKTRPGTKETLLLPHLGHFSFAASCSDMVSVARTFSRISRNDIGRSAWVRIQQVDGSMRNLLQDADLEKPIPRCLLLAFQRALRCNVRVTPKAEVETPPQAGLWTLSTVVAAVAKS